MKINSKIISSLIVVGLVLGLGFFIYNSFKPKTTYAIEEGLPQFVLGNKDSELAYSYASEMQDQFEYLTCYCGCGTHAMTHRGKTIPKMYSLKDCFIRTDGTWEDHAAFDCPACINLAIEATNMLKSGASLKDVRNYIDNTYGRYGGGTETPYPN